MPGEIPTPQLARKFPDAAGGSLTPAGAPLIDAENLFRQPGPPHSTGLVSHDIEASEIADRRLCGFEATTAGLLLDHNLKAHAKRPQVVSDIFSHPLDQRLTIQCRPPTTRDTLDHVGTVFHRVHNYNSRVRTVSTSSASLVDGHDTVCNFLAIEDLDNAHLLDRE